jgi:hypothetical protein
MVTEKMSSRRVARIATVFRMGANNLASALCASDHTSSGDNDNLVTSFFSGTSARFMTSDNTRPDALPQSGMSREFVRQVVFNVNQL